MKKSKLILVISLFVGIFAISTIVLANNQNPVQTEKTTTSHHRKDGKCDHKTKCDGKCENKGKCEHKGNCEGKKECKDKKEGQCPMMGKCDHKKATK